MTKQPYEDNLCLFYAIPLHIRRSQRMEEETAKNFISFRYRKNRVSHNEFQGVQRNLILVVEHILTQCCPVVELQAMGCLYHLCPCRKIHPTLTEEVIQQGSKQRELNALRRHYKQEKGYNVNEMWESE